MNQWAVHYEAIINLFNTLSMISLTAIYVYFTIKIQRANSKVVEQNEITRKENNMPVIIVYFDMTIFNILDIKIKNIGKSPAKNIMVKLEPFNEIVNVQYLNKASFIDKKIALLAPDQSLKTMVGTLMEIKNSKGDYPIYRINIVFEDLYGNDYSSEYIIDSNMYKGNVQVIDKNLHDLTKVTEKIESHIRKLTQ